MKRTVLTIISSVLFVSLALFGCSSPGGGGGGGADTTAPLLQSTTPILATVDQSTKLATLELTFDEAVTTGSGSITITDNSGPTVFDTIATTNVTGTGTVTVYAALNKSLRENTTYSVQIPNGFIVDMATIPNAYAGITDTITWTIATEAVDSIAPDVVSTTPADNATGVSGSLPSLSITFDEDVQINALGGSITIDLVSGGTLSTIVPASLTGSGTKTITIPFSEAMSDGVEYCVTIPSDLFYDYAGTPNYFTGIADTTTWSFTAVADTAAPVLQSTTPVDDSADSSCLLSELTMTFNEDVIINTGNVIVYQAGPVVIDTIPAGSITVDGNKVTIPLGVTLSEGQSYYVQVDSGLVSDKIPNNFTGILDDTTWNFTIVADTDAPVLQSTIPADDATGIAETISSLTVVFDENVDLVDQTTYDATTGIRIFDSDDGVTPHEILPYSAIAGSGTTTLTLTLSVALIESNTYYIEIPGTILFDQASTPNAYPGMADSATWNFTVLADTVTPVITVLSPADETTAVPLSTAALSITFDDVVMVGTGDVTIYNSDTTTFETIPAANLTGSGTATITIPFTNALVATTAYYYVNFPATLFYDDATTPNYVAAISDSTTWNFTSQPAVPEITGLNTADDTAGANTAGTTTDGITRNTTGLTIDGTADANVGINIYVGGALENSPGPTTTADPSGNWSWDLAGSYTDGDYNITASAVVTGFESSQTSVYTLTVDTIAPVIRTEVAAATKVVVLTTTSPASVFTAETGTGATYTGTVNPYSVSIEDIAGNKSTVNNVYTTAAGIRSAVAAVVASATETIYIAENGTYDLGGGPANFIDYTVNAALTIKGVSLSVVVLYNTNNDVRAVFNMGSDGSLNLDTLSIGFNRDAAGFTNINLIGNVSGTPAGTLYFRNIEMSDLNSTITPIELVDVTTTGAVYAWNGASYDQITVTGGGWTVSGSTYKFPGTIGVTYWP
ncbi:MAG: Ig-like domain-containing protein [Spirochaetales bacterium]|nr:Ig-like domain-containing protein [Spirochaetales bacterium]